MRYQHTVFTESKILDGCSAIADTGTLLKKVEGVPVYTGRNTLGV
jgi:hypothetical protein